MQQPGPSEETSALLARLAQRPGVQSTLIISRDTGAIVRSSGLLSADDAVSTETTAAAQPPQTNGESDFKPVKKGTRQAEDVARIVWKFVQGCGDVVEELNGEGDEVKLLRLRTKRNELVVVPDAKFLLVVVHETAPA